MGKGGLPVHKPTYTRKAKLKMFYDHSSFFQFIIIEHFLSLSSFESGHEQVQYSF